MAMRPERSKPLHNFALPCLKWGSQRFLRCVNVTSQNNQPQPSSLDRRSSRFQSKFQQPHINKIEPFSAPKRKPNNTTTDNNIAGVQEKLMVDLGVTVKKLKVSIFEDRNEGAGGDAHARPWNLRTRRAACKAPQSTTPTTPHEEKCKFFDVGSASSPVREKKTFNETERAKLKVSLSKEEVEHDFLALGGTRPPRRPKKRPRIVQRQLDTLFPGLWLTEVTAESYKVTDVPE